MSDSGARLYGRVMGHGSHAQVTRGFEVALLEAKLLDSVVGLDVSGLNDYDSAPWAKVGHVGAMTKHGVFTGPLEMMDQMLRAKHERRWVMVAPNSNWMPERYLKALDAVATDVLVPSRWAAAVLGRLLSAGRTSHEIHVVPHGVHAGFERNPQHRERVVADYQDGQFRVLHCSTSERQRKGTWELLQAWQLLMRNHELPERAELFLLLDYAAQLRLAERMLDADLNPPNVHLLTRLDAAPEAFADVLRRVHVVCQPSRGEAFGLVPLEALACGTPIVATSCTGQGEYLACGMSRTAACTAGVLIVNSGPDRPIDDGPGAVAPSVDPESIRVRLFRMYESWAELSAAAFDAAPEVCVDWSWPRQLAPWLEQLQ